MVPALSASYMQEPDKHLNRHTKLQSRYMYGARWKSVTYPQQINQGACKHCSWLIDQVEILLPIHGSESLMYDPETYRTGFCMQFTYQGKPKMKLARD